MVVDPDWRERYFLDLHLLTLRDFKRRPTLGALIKRSKDLLRSEKVDAIFPRTVLDVQSRLRWLGMIHAQHQKPQAITWFAEQRLVETRMREHGYDSYIHCNFSSSCASLTSLTFDLYFLYLSSTDCWMATKLKREKCKNELNVKIPDYMSSNISHFSLGWTKCS